VPLAPPIGPAASVADIAVRGVVAISRVVPVPWEGGAGAILFSIGIELTLALLDVGRVGLVADGTRTATAMLSTASVYKACTVANFAAIVNGAGCFGANSVGCGV
jgi:hypothetical protein